MSSWLVCDCAQRHAAEKLGEFFYWANFEAWVFSESVPRRMSTLARYYAAERGVENHDGEPFRWVNCPWCGLDLPKPVTPTTNWDEGNG